MNSPEPLQVPVNLCVAKGLRTDSRLNCTFRLPIQAILDPGILPDVLHLYLEKNMATEASNVASQMLRELC